MRNDNVRLDRLLAAGVVLLAVLVFAGCRTTRHLQAGGMPGDEYLVGGGLMIEWEAPTDGTAYLVEKETGKIIETRSLAEGETYSFSVSTGVQAQEFEKVLGIDFGQARFLLYFKPIAGEE